MYTPVDHLQKSFITSNTIPDTVPEHYFDVALPDQATPNNNATLPEMDALQKGTDLNLTFLHTHVHF